MRRPVQFFGVNWPVGGSQLFCLDNEGKVWRLLRSGFGDDGRGWPREVRWVPAEQHDYLPELPQDGGGS